MKIETEEIEIEEWKPELPILQSNSENEIRKATGKVTLSNGSPCSSENEIRNETCNDIFQSVKVKTEVPENENLEICTVKKEIVDNTILENSKIYFSGTEYTEFSQKAQKFTEISMDICSSVKNFKCTFKTCGNLFENDIDLKRHIKKVHVGQKQLINNQCNSKQNIEKKFFSWDCIAIPGPCGGNGQKFSRGL